MIDPLAGVAAAVGGHDLVRLPLALVAGAATSLGPCAAPRYLAIAALAARGDRLAVAASFAAGMLLTYATLGSGLAWVAALTANAGAIDVALALALGAGGLHALLRPPAASGCTHRLPRAGRSAFVLGAASALVVAPCCTPVLVAAAGMAAFAPAPQLAIAYLALFLAGHTLPLLVLGIAGGSAGRRWWPTGGEAATTVGGALMLALGAYYGLLA